MVSIPNDLRHYLEILIEERELVRVGREVDWNLEIGAIAFRVLEQKGPALLFEVIKDAAKGARLLTAAFGTFARYGLALGLPKISKPSEIIETFYERIKRPIPPVTVRSGPCQENIVLGKDVDLFSLPAPKWNRRDGGRYIGTLDAVITKDPESGWINVGMYRMMIRDRDMTNLEIGSWNHAGMHLAKYEKAGEAMPVAVCLGVDPAIFFTGCAPFGYGVNELEMAGALMRRPVELVKCATIDLEVPANAEIVLEGEVPPKVREIEGPFGEHTGTYGFPPSPMPVFKVKAITFRNNPIATGTLEKVPVSEDNLMSAIGNAVLAWHELDRVGIPVRSVFYPPAACGFYVAIVSAPKSYPGRAVRIAHAIWGSRVGATTTNWVIVVDEDIDPSNPDQVLWAIASRCSPERGVQIMRRTPVNPLLPFLTPEQRKGMYGGSKVLIDASWPDEWPVEYIPPIANWEDIPEEVRRRVLENWEKYGLGA